jgi:hypothetical protein
MALFRLRISKQKNFTNPIFNRKIEKPKNEFEVDLIKWRGSVLGTALLEKIFGSFS